MSEGGREGGREGEGDRKRDGGREGGREGGERERFTKSAVLTAATFVAPVTTVVLPITEKIACHAIAIVTLELRGGTGGGWRFNKSINVISETAAR